MILRSHHYLKRDGIDSRLSVDIGSLENHSLRNIVRNGESGTIIFKFSDIIIVVKNEVDFLNMANSLNFKLVSVNEINISNKKYFQYLFFKAN